MAANIVKVYSVGLQGPAGSPGPTGSLSSDNSGSFTITGSLNITGSVTSSFFTGSYYGDGSNLTGINSTGSTKEYGLYNLNSQDGFSTNDYITTGINLQPEVSSSTFSISYDSGSGVFDGFTSGKLYELEFMWLVETTDGNNDVRFQWEKDGSLIGNNSIAIQQNVSSDRLNEQANITSPRAQTNAKTAFISDGTEDLKIRCTNASGVSPFGFNGDFSFITIKEI